jgi:DnaK suppressor protein
MLSLGEQELKRLQLVEGALEKMDQGQYGHCSECENPIPVARLEVVPFTEHCVECLHSIEEKGQPDQHR